MPLGALCNCMMAIIDCYFMFFVGRVSYIPLGSLCNCIMAIIDFFKFFLGRMCYMTLSALCNCIMAIIDQSNAAVPFAITATA